MKALGFKLGYWLGFGVGYVYAAVRYGRQSQGH
jgi:hypothetical protein